MKKALSLGFVVNITKILKKESLKTRASSNGGSPDSDTSPRPKTPPIIKN
jgi:hypothetical protein